jgi:predicted nucleic acid-binding protein
MPAQKVVDSWAILAWLRDEPSAALVEQILLNAYAGVFNLLMSWYNAAEVFYTLAKREGTETAEEFLSRLPSLPIRVVLPDEDGIVSAARIKGAHPVAFGDAFAIALAQSEDASVITGDNEIRRCGVVPVHWVGV